MDGVSRVSRRSLFYVKYCIVHIEHLNIGNKCNTLVKKLLTEYSIKEFGKVLKFLDNIFLREVRILNCTY